MHACCTACEGITLHRVFRKAYLRAAGVIQVKVVAICEVYTAKWDLGER